MNTSSTSSARTPARSSAHLIAIAPSFGAGTGARPPRNAPIGVRAAPRMTVSLIWPPAQSRGFAAETRLRQIGLARRGKAAPRSFGLLEALHDVLAIRADLIAESGELAQTLAHGREVRVEQLDEARKHFGIGVMATVERFELLHLGERETEHLELLDELEPADVIVRVHALPAIEPLHRFEEAALFVVPNGPLGQPDLRGQLSDPVCRGPRGRCRHG